MTARPAPRVTVLLPVRDGAMFLSQAVQSILGQTMPDFELLVVDDGSADATPALLAACRDPRLRVLRQGRLGLVAALNRGLHETLAPLIARMDADDVARPERLAAQVAAMAANPGVTLVGSAYQVLGSHGRRVIRPPADPAAALRRANCIAHPTVMVRRDAVLQAGGYRTAFLHAEDYDLWLRLAERHRLMNLDAVLLDYREHAGQTAWRGLEQRILSEMGALAAAGCRDAGQPDGVGETPIDRASLRRMGMTEAAIAGGITARAMGSAKDALAAGHRTAARAAVRLALQQAVRPRTRVHLWALGLRSLL